MARWGFVYDQARCIGCHACQIACKDKNNLEKGMFFRRVETVECIKEGKRYWKHYSGACNHCAKAACVTACQSKAMYYDENGIVLQDEGKCIGCGACTWACPYGAAKVSHRLGIAMKCDACAEERKEGKKPICVRACLTHCLDFLNLDEMTKCKKKGEV